MTLKAPSWKVAALEVLAERPGKPVVAFAPSRQLMLLAGRAATEAGYTVGDVIGGQGMRERTETVGAFQAVVYLTPPDAMETGRALTVSVRGDPHRTLSAATGAILPQQAGRTH